MPEKSSRGRRVRGSGCRQLLTGPAGLLVICCLAGTARSQILTPEESGRIEDGLSVIRSKDPRAVDLRQAAGELGRMTSPAARARLLDEARKARKAREEEPVLFWTCRALVEAEPAAVASILIEMLERSAELLSPRLVELLGETGDRRAVEPLLKVLRSPSPRAPRPQAVSALAWIDDPEARKAVFQALDDEDYDAREAAGEGVVRIASGSARTVGRADEVVTLLMERIEKSEGRQAARFIGLLAKVGGDTAASAVTGYLVSGEEEVLEAAMRAAGTLKAKGAADLLLGIALDDRRPVRIRVLAMGALADVKAEKRLGELVPLLESKDARLRKGAHTALQRLVRKRLPLAVGVWDVAVRRFDDEREFGPVLEPDLELLPRPVRRASPLGQAYAQPSPPPPMLYVVIALSGAALVAALLLLRPALRRRAAKAIRTRRRRRSAF